MEGQRHYRHLRHRFCVSFLLRFTSIARASSVTLLESTSVREDYGMFTPNLSKMMLLIGASVLALEGAFTLHGAPEQNPAQAFEVISVKSIPSQPIGGRGSACLGRPQIEPARFAVSRTNVYSLIAWAYAQRCSNSEAHDLITSGPGWVKSDLFEIQAVIPPGTPTYPPGQFTDGVGSEVQSMIRNLLADRFKLAIHSENREMPVYALTVTRNGSKLQPFDEDTCDSSPPPFPPQPIQPGQKRRCSNMITLGRDRKMRIAANGITVERLSELLSLALDRPVLNRTGISGIFDIRVESSIEGTRLAELPTPDGDQPRTVSDPAPSIFTAIQDQLGLRLESTRGPVPTLVIDSVSRPTEN